MWKLSCGGRHGRDAGSGSIRVGETNVTRLMFAKPNADLSSRVQWVEPRWRKQDAQTWFSSAHALTKSGVTSAPAELPRSPTASRRTKLRSAPQSLCLDRTDTPKVKSRASSSYGAKCLRPRSRSSNGFATCNCPLSPAGLHDQRVGLLLKLAHAFDIARPGQNDAVETGFLQPAQTVDHLLFRADDLIAGPAADEMRF